MSQVKADSVVAEVCRISVNSKRTKYCPNYLNYPSNIQKLKARWVVHDVCTLSINSRPTLGGKATAVEMDTKLPDYQKKWSHNDAHFCFH